jgi:hypothetical protein
LFKAALDLIQLSNSILRNFVQKPWQKPIFAKHLGTTELELRFILFAVDLFQKLADWSLKTLQIFDVFYFF